MAFSYYSIDEMIQRSMLEGLEALSGLGVSVTLYCPWQAPTRWERIKDDVLTFVGWR